MKERMVCLIWCEWCCNRHWDRTNRFDEEGRLVSKSGTLKANIRCESCWKEIRAGEEVTAFTIDGGTDYVTWEDEYMFVEADCGAADSKVGGL